MKELSECSSICKHVHICKRGYMTVLVLISKSLLSDQEGDKSPSDVAATDGQVHLTTFGDGKVRINSWINMSQRWSYSE